MNENAWHLAQINVAKIIGEDITDPVMEKFVAQLDEINALAEGSPGFIWRLKDNSNNATRLNPYDDQTIIINISVWESLDHLIQFVYHGRHADVLRKRRDWFVNFGKPFTALWYLNAGDVPTIEEGVARLRRCRRMDQHLTHLILKQSSVRRENPLPQQKGNNFIEQ